MKYAILIYNPSSGEASIAERLDMIIARYSRAGITLVPLRLVKERTFFATRLQPLVDALSPAHIILAGGDGTINHYVNYAFSHGLDIPIAILPAGTANDFANMLGMRPMLSDSIEQILAATPRPIDLGRVNDRYFVNILSGGLMTKVSQRTPTALKNLLGKGAYFFSVLGELSQYRRITISATSPEGSYHGECLLFMVFNGRSAGAVPVAKNASLDDGLLEVLIVKGNSLVNTIGDLLHILLYNNGTYPDDIVYFRSSALKIECSDNPPSDMDGERGPHFPMNIQCVNGAVKVLF